MKKLHLLLLSITLCVFSACHNDIWDAIDGLDSRVTKLEELCKEMNTNITSLQTIVSVLQSNDFITGIVEIKKNGEVIGYTITFGKHDPITIYHGQNGKDGADGKDGSTPVIGVAQDTDGVYYWTLNGEWLLDDNGNKLPVSGKDGQNGTNGSNGQDGKDGITPQLKIEEGYWYISYDNGATWTQLGKATGEDGKDGTDGEDGKDGQNGTDGKDGQDGDSMFQSVTQDENYVYFTLADGTVIKIAKGNGQNNQPNENDIINFRDLAVKSALLKLGIDTTKDNEISYGEAAAFTGEISITDKTSIYSFKEFQYFTSMTSIGNDAFSGCSNLFEIMIPNNIKTIGDNAFAYCTSLSCITIPKNVTSIGRLAFYSCSSLTSITILNDAISVGANAFANDPQLESFTFPENYNGEPFVFGTCEFDQYGYDIPTTSPKTIYWNTIDYQKDFFENRDGYNYTEKVYGICGGIERKVGYNPEVIILPKNTSNIIFGDEVKTIPNYLCAYMDGLTTITLPNNVIGIGNGAFCNSSVTSINIPNSVTSIGSKAFYECKNIESIMIPNNVVTIESYLCAYCPSLTSVTIGNSVTNIDNYAFYSCSSLKYLYCKTTTPPLLGSSAIPNTIGIIYVPRASVDEYKALWSEYADKIIGYDFE